MAKPKLRVRMTPSAGWVTCEGDDPTWTHIIVMAESARDLLRREFAELVAEARASWSARAVVQANRMLRGSEDREGRRIILVAELGIDPDGEGLWHTSELIRQIESRAWLLDHVLTEAEPEREEMATAKTCRWCENPAPAGELCSRCRATVAGTRDGLAAHTREVLNRIDSGLISRMLSAFVAEVRQLRRLVGEADDVDWRMQARRRKLERKARGRS
jgi:hypothetical protein